MKPTIAFDDVADIYDYYVTVDFDTRFWIEEAHHIGGEALELMAGTGRISIPLLEAGVSLTCVDYSQRMLDVLRRKLVAHSLVCPVVEADVAELSLGREFDFVFIGFNSFSEITDPLRQRLALMRIHEHLRDDGRFICTLHNPVKRLESIDGAERVLGSCSLPEGRELIFHSRLSYDPDSHIASGVQRYEILTPEKKVELVRSLEVQFTLLCEKSFRNLVTECGFRVTALYGNYDRSLWEPSVSPFMIWEMRKK